MEALTFEDWYDQNEESINIELAESGADREMDFDPEYEFEARYEEYLHKVMDDNQCLTQVGKENHDG